MNLKVVSLVAAQLLLLPLAARAAGTLKVPSASFPTIQSAVDAAVSAGGAATIVVAKGTYKESVTIDSASGLVLRGKGKVVIDAQVAGPGVTVVHGDLVELRGLTIINFNGAGILVQGSADTHVVKCFIDATSQDDPSSGDGIRAENDVGISIERNLIQAVDGDGIRLDGASEASIEKNRVLDVHGTAGIYLFHENETPPNGGATRSHVFGNKIAVLDPLPVGIFVGGTDNTIERNDVGTESDGLVSAADATGTKFSGNVVASGSGNGIVVNGASNFLHRNIISAVDVLAAGIVVNTGADRASMARNTIKPSGNGLVIDATDCASVHDRILKPKVLGIEINGTNNQFTNDVVTQAGNDAFQITGNDNLFTGCKAIKAVDDGFDVDGDGNKIDRSFSSNAGGDGFVVFGHDNELTKCGASHSGDFDLLDPDEGATTNTYTDCKFKTSTIP
jgi:nitrous oxidase accessory protein NosD